VTRKQVFEFATELEKFPTRYPDAWRGKRVQEIVKLAENRPDLKCLAPQTINDRSVGALKSFFQWCIRRQIIEINPAVGVALDVPKAAEKPRDPYRIDHLRMIFSQDVFTKGQRLKRGGGEAMYWVPLIALYTGMRLEEIGQLRLEDLRCEDSIHFFDLREGLDQALKTRSSARRVPIHADLIKRGLLVEKARLEDCGQARLFPEFVKSREGKYTAAFSKYWGIWTSKIGISDPRLVFHSFRHAFKDRCRDCKISRAISEALMGHAGQSVGDEYGSGFALSELAEAIGKINWSPVFEIDQASPHSPN
jgi:integrase